MQPIGILAAVHDEIAGLLAEMGPGAKVKRIGLRDYYQGTLCGCSCVLVLARMGKVAAAATTVTLIREFDVQAVVFTGLAGGIGAQIRVGDIVVARSLIQHDMDARPLFPRYQVPLLERSYFDVDTALSATLIQSATAYLADDFPGAVGARTRGLYGIDMPSIHHGLIASGDIFVNDARTSQTLASALPDVLCVEMEGAAVAQICHEYGVRCAVLRTVSDRADSVSHIDFEAFLKQVASLYSLGILRRFLAQLARA